MPFDYIRGIVRPDGKVCVEYLVTGEEEPGQVVSDSDLSTKSDDELRIALKSLSPLFDDPDYSTISINREWFEKMQES